MMKQTPRRLFSAGVPVLLSPLGVQQRCWQLTALGAVLVLLNTHASAKPHAEAKPSTDVKPSAPAEHTATTAEQPRPSIFGRRILRQGFHFQATLGAGIGPHLVGLYHAMELGWSFSGYSVSLLHTFLQNKGVFGTTWGGPDEIGGFMLQVKGPLYFQDLSWKLASGVGGTVDQPDGEFNANPGFGIHYGVDLHFPIWPKFGPTLSLDMMNVFEGGQHYFGTGLGLGFTIF